MPLRCRQLVLLYAPYGYGTGHFGVYALTSVAFSLGRIGPERLYDYAKTAKGRGIRIIIAGAGGAAHLPGMAAALTPLPVLGVPMPTSALGGQDSLYSIVQMPAGIPVGTLAIGRAGAINAALLAAAILALNDAGLAERLAQWRQEQSDAVALSPDSSLP